MSIVETLAKDTASAVVGQKDTTILAAIVSRWPDFMMVNTEEVKRRGDLKSTQIKLRFSYGMASRFSNSGR